MQSNFHFSFKPDCELHQGVYGDWVHAWHLWPRGLPSYTRWLQIACAELPVDNRGREKVSSGIVMVIVGSSVAVLRATRSSGIYLNNGGCVRLRSDWP